MIRPISGKVKNEIQLYYTNIIIFFPEYILSKMYFQNYMFCFCSEVKITSHTDMYIYKIKTNAKKI